MMEVENVDAKKMLSETNVPNVKLNILLFQLVMLACATLKDPLTILVMTMANVPAMTMLKERSATNVSMDSLSSPLVTNALPITMDSPNVKLVSVMRMDLRPLSVTKMENVLASLTSLETSATKVNPDTMISPIPKSVTAILMVPWTKIVTIPMENVPAKNTLLATNVINALPDFSVFPNAKNVDAVQKELWTVLVTKMEFALAKNM